MQNVKISVDKKGIMTIIIDTNKELGMSKSGKTMMVASTKGNKEAAPGIILGVNCYKMPKGEGGSKMENVMVFKGL